MATGMIHSRLGLNGVALFYRRDLSGVWLWFRLHWSLHGNFWSPLPWPAPAFHLQHTLAGSPHVVGWLFLLCAVLGALKYGQTAQLIAVGVFACCGRIARQFFLAPVIALVFCDIRTDGF